MTFNDFVNKINSTGINDYFSFKNPGSAAYNNLMLAFVIIGVVILLISIIKFKDKINSKITINSLFFLIVVVLIICLLFLIIGFKKADYEAKILTYIEYMQLQEDEVIQIDGYSFVLDEYSILLESLFYNIEDCKECPLKLMTFYKDGKAYQMEVLVKAVLEENERAYILTKPRLKENVGEFKKDLYYQPILYLPKSELLYIE